MILAGDDCGGHASGCRVTEPRSFLAVLFVATNEEGSVCAERRDFR